MKYLKVWFPILRKCAWCGKWTGIKWGWVCLRNLFIPTHGMCKSCLEKSA